MARVDSKGSRMEKRMMEGKTRNRDEADLLPSLLFSSLFSFFLIHPSAPSRAEKNERRDR